MTTYFRVFEGTAFTARSPKEIDVLKDHLFCVDANGIIARTVAPDADDYEAIRQRHADEGRYQRLGPGQYLLPGFVDLHVHAPQWAQSGTSLDVPLYDWLHAHTFPLESKFADLGFAAEVYDDLVATLLANGTTTALYFATIHKESSLLLAEICAKKDSAAWSARSSWTIPRKIPITTVMPIRLPHLRTRKRLSSPSRRWRKTSSRACIPS